MCGIAGIYTTKNQLVDERDVQAMADSLTHRGPDDEGVYVDHHVGLAFRRLSIIDLSAAGHQPMANEDGTIHIIFNGEIYNYRELGAALRAKGYRFRSKTDTEVLLHAYEEYGHACVKRLNGMFAFAIYDKKKNLLFCARDRLGIKPLYYAFDGERFAFGSEIKALLAAGVVRPEVNIGALNEYFSFQNIFSDQTLFAGIHTLPAGHTLTIDVSRKLALERYWNPEFRPHKKTTFREAVENLRSIFSRSTTRHLIGDVPIGSQLSGGMDSASLVAVATQSIPHFMTFTAGFDIALAEGFELNFDERHDAEHVARHVKSEHYTMMIQPGDMERILPRLIWHLEDLRLGNSYPNYYICQLASKFVKVALSGAGGDELFAGYPWRYELVKDAHDPKTFDKLYFNYWMRLMPEEHKKKFFTPGAWQQMSPEAPFQSYRDVISPVDDLDPLSKCLYFELKTFLHGLLLVEDKVSSAHGLEVRVPFLDTNLIDFALALPPEWKIKKGVGKAILREALKPYLPKEIIHKKKQGFAAPERTWFRKSSLDYTKKHLLSPESLSREYIQPRYVEQIIREHVAGKTNHRLLIWSLLSFEWWLRVFMDQRSGELTRSFAARNV